MNKNEILNEWHGMPEFKQEKKIEYKKIKITFIDGSYLFLRFANKKDFEIYQYRNIKFNFCNITAQRFLLSKVIDQKITEKTKSCWYPFKSHWGLEKKAWVSNEYDLPKYPVYIVSKGRADNGLTTKALNKMGVKHYIVVEIHEAEEYKEKTNADILVLPSKYLNNYDTCDELGNTRSKGPGAARNFCIDHSKENGFKRHWVMDDNLDAFHRLNNNEKYEIETGATLKASEDFVDRYLNVPVAGLNYYSFCKKTDSVPPFTLNTRIYSCLLIDNLSGYRWRGRYNEDTDLSLRVLKDGNCTIQFNAFLCGKVTTQRMKGGNTKEFYSEEGTLPKSQMIADLHPDVASVVWRFNRWHHNVNYKVFKINKLIKKEKCIHNLSINNFGMELLS
jgi:hypothetical protein